MLESSVATECIYAFGREANVSSSEPLFENDLEATQCPKSVLDRLDYLEAENHALKVKLEALEKDLDAQAENQLIQLRLIHDLRKDREPQPLQRDRGEILRAILAANGGKMLATEARHKMRLSRQTFSALIKSAHGDIEIRPYHLNRSWNLLTLK